MAGDEQSKLGGGQPSGLVMGSSAHALEAAMCVSCGGRGEVVHSVGGPAGGLWASHLSSARAISLLLVEDFRAVRKIPSDKKILMLKAGI